MKTIWKYPLAIDGHQQVWMPQGAKILSVMMQGGQLCAWAEVQSDNTPEMRQFIIRGTGRIIHEPANTMWREQHLASVIIDPFVWHVYELVHG